MLRLVVVNILLGFLCWPQGTDPKPDHRAYRLQASSSAADYGIEYQVRTVSAGRDTFLTEDYLVIEVAVFPKRREKLKIDLRNFTLVLDGKGDELLAQTPGIVAASFKYPDWATQSGVQMAAGVGDRGVILGRPPMTERFPGDPRPSQRRLPRPPAEGSGQVAEAPDAERPDAATLIQTLALPEGVITRPISGYIFFPYRGRLGAIKQVTLNIAEEGSEVPLAVRLR
jgi:hypothetical protein